MGCTGTDTGTASGKAADEFDDFASATQQANDAADDFEFADFAAAEPVATLNVRITSAAAGFGRAAIRCLASTASSINVACAGGPEAYFPRTNGQCI
jgi:hypothetical protein